MNDMAYKDFAWPANPEKLEIRWSREVRHGKNSDGQWEFAGLGPIGGTVSGSGVFTGELAYDNYLTLRALYEQSTAGSLVLPDGLAADAYFTGLTVCQDARPYYVHYSFVFHLADDSGVIPK